MGGVLDRHASGERHLQQPDYAKEAFIHWNAPKALQRQGVALHKVRPGCEDGIARPSGEEQRVQGVQGGGPPRL
eukprot:scaffold100221_cov90-Phaeocystis_antarctica.AAC.2